MNTDAINKLIASKPALRNAREKLEAMQDGAYCQHLSWGFGQIKRYDAKTERLIIDFPESGKTDHPMAPEFCVDKLVIFPADNILVRHRTETKVVEDLIKNHPAELIKQILLAAPKQSMSGIELDSILTRLVGAAKLKKWWAANRRHIAQDADIATPVKKDGYYVLRDEPLTPEQEILESYKLNKNPLQKILLAEELFKATVRTAANEEDADEDGESEPDAEVAEAGKRAKERLSQVEVRLSEEDLRLIFAELTEAIASPKRMTRLDPNEDEFSLEAKERAVRLHGIWVRNDLCRHFQEDVDHLAPTSRSIIEYCYEKKLLSGLAAKIPQTSASLKRLLDLITRVYPDEALWLAIILELLQKSSGKFTAECVNFLVDRGSAARVGQKLLEWLNSRELESPILSWIIKNRASEKHRAIVTPLVNHRLLSAILQAIDYEAIHSSSTRRIPLAEELSDDKTLIPDLLRGGDSTTASEGGDSDANEAKKEEGHGEIACDLAKSILLCQGFEPLTKKSLLARFIQLYDDGKKTKASRAAKVRAKIHAKLQSLVAGETEQSEELVVSQWSLDARRDELRDIIENKIPENKKAIAIAKEHGDLKENSEYKMARQDQETLAARRAQLERDLSLARVSDFSDASTEVAGIGTTVELRNGETGKTDRFTILGAWDSDPDKNILSYKTPLAQKLLNQKVGDTVQTEVGDNVESWTIRSIARWVDAKNK